MKKLMLLGLLFVACNKQTDVATVTGVDGSNGGGCTSVREEGRVKISCSNGDTYVYDGQNGQNGVSCSVTPTEGGAMIACGEGQPVYVANGSPGPQGTTGPQGEPGRDGLNGQDGENAFKPGLSCNLHNVKSWDGNTSLPEVFKNNPEVGNFTLDNLSVPDSPSSAGFPGMPANLQSIVGLEGYALDCHAYLNVNTSGTYTLKLLSDDGSRLAINDEVVIENQGLHAPKTVSEKVELHRGPNKINVTYYQGPHSQIALELKMSGPNMSEQVVPSTQFRH
jgi:hypothetical protein